MTTLHDLFPDIALIGQIIGKCSGAVFDALVTRIAQDRAEAHAYLLTKALRDAVVPSQVALQGQRPSGDDSWTPILAQFNLKGAGS